MSCKEQSYHEWEQLMRKVDPVLPILDTIELIENIPEGKWTTPEPYEWLDHEDMMSKKVDGLILPWIDYLQTVDKGRELSRKFREEGIITGDVEAHKAFSSFSTIEGIEGENHEEKINSIKRGFASLISIKRREEEELPENVGENKTDILNAKRFVDVIGKRSIGFGLLELEE